MIIINCNQSSETFFPVVSFPPGIIRQFELDLSANYNALTKYVTKPYYVMCHLYGDELTLSLPFLRFQLPFKVKR